MSSKKFMKYLLPGAATILFASILIITLSLTVFAAPAADYGITPTELDSMAIDPQSWKLQDAMTWQDDFVPNPAINYLKDNTGIKPTRKLRGLLVLVEYCDQPWITGRPLGSEIMGNPRSGPKAGESIQDFWLKLLNEPGEWNNNTSVQEYWFENSYGAWDVTLDVAGPIQLPYFEFTYGFYDSTAFTGNTDSGQVGRFGNVFPARRTTGSDAMVLINQMPELQFFDPVTGAEIYDFMYYQHSGYAQSNTWQEFGEMMFADKKHIVWRDGAGDIQFAKDLKDPYTNKPLTNISPITGETITGLDFTGWARLDSIERTITAPGFDIVKEWPNFYMVDIEGRWRTQVCTGTAYNNAYTAYQAANPVAAAFNAWRTPLTTATQANYQTNVYLPAFQRLYAQDMKYIDKNGDLEDPNNWTAAWKAYLEDNTSEKIIARLLDMIHQGKTYAENHPTNPYMAYVRSRYGIDPWSSWYGGVPVWSSGGSSVTCWKAGRSVTFSTQGESNALGTYIHEFGHIIGVPDNYADPFSDSPRRQPVGTWDLMGSGSMGGPGGGHTRWLIPPSLGASTPPNQVFRGKLLGGFHGAANSAERKASVLEVNYADLSSRLVMGEVYARNIPTNKGVLDANGQPIDGLRGIRIWNMTNAGPRLTIANTLLPARDPYGFSRINPLYWNYGSSSSITFNNYTMEVVQRTGYDSFVSDSGVMIALNGNDSVGLSTDSTFPADSHPGDKKIADFRHPVTGAYTPVPDGHQEQLATILFHAGLHNNPYYYSDIGGATRRFAPEDLRPGVAGDVKNEYVDTYNKLHFYILDKNYTPGKHGEILSYDVAVRRTDSTYSSNGTLILKQVGVPQPATIGNFAVQKYSLTNTGTSTDIARIVLSGPLTETVGLGHTKDQNVVLLNNLYAIGAGETIEFDVYIKNNNSGFGFDASKLLTVTAKSETNNAKQDALAGPILKNSYYVYLSPSVSGLGGVSEFTVDVVLHGDMNYTQVMADVTFDSSKLKLVSSQAFGWVSAIAPAGDGKVTLRSVPVSNMVLGTTCLNTAVIATLKFKVLDIPAGGTTTLKFASASVTPSPGAVGIKTLPTLPLTLKMPAAPAAALGFMEVIEEFEEKVVE